MSIREIETSPKQYIKVFKVDGYLSNDPIVQLKKSHNPVVKFLSAELKRTGGFKLSIDVKLTLKKKHRMIKNIKEVLILYTKQLTFPQRL